jgi:ERCC4-type nuclease
LVWKNWSGREWTFDSLWGAVASMALEARVGTFWVRSEQEFVSLVQTLSRWNGREKHTTTRTRSRPRAKGWGVSQKIQQAHFLQGLPGVGPELAERIVEFFGGIPMAWTVTSKQLTQVPGVGKQKVAKLGEMVGFDEPPTA